MPNIKKIVGPLGELLSKMPAGSRAAQEAIAAEMAARKAAQEAAYAAHTLPTEKGKKTIAKTKKMLGKEDEAVQAPSVIIPSKVSNVEQAIRQSKGEYGAKRVQRAADQVKNLEQQYSEEALRQAFGGDNATALMIGNPAEFQNYATRLQDPYRSAIESYMQRMSGNGGGADDVPFLQLNKEGITLPFVSGHEGRHRNLALEELGDENTLWRMLPRANLREPFPRRSQEEYLQALIERIGQEPLVVPEDRFLIGEKTVSGMTQEEAIKAGLYKKRDWTEARKLPPLFADGGAVNMPNFFNTDVNFGGNQPNIPVPEINASMLGQVSKAKGGVIDLDEIVNRALQASATKMAGGGRTRAGTPASPTPLDEQIERTKRRFKGFMDDPDQELRNIARQYFPSDTDTPEERSQKLEDLAMGFAGTTIGKVPRMSKAQSIEAGLYHPVGRGKKLTRPVNEVEFTRAPDPNMPIAPKKIITPEDLFDKQGYPVTWDPSAAGELLTGMRGKLFQEPVVLQGGEGYQRTHGGLQSPQKLAVASHPGVIKRHSNIIKRIASEGDEPVSVVLAMSPGHSLDYNKMIAQTLMQEIKNSKISSKLAKEFDEEVRKQFPNFVGIKNKKLDEQLNSDTSGNLRKYVADRMMLDQFQKGGFPDVIETRVAISNPEMLNADLGSGGSSFGLMDPAGGVILDPLNPHNTYLAASPGTYFGGMQPRFSTEELFPTFYEQRRLLSADPTDDWYTFGRSIPTQRFDQEWLDKIMPLYEQRMKELTGKKKGGLAEGGVPEKRDVSQLFPLKWSADANLHKGRTGVWTDTNDVFTGAMSGLFNTLAGGLRGRVIGTAGIPGDIIEGMSDLEGAIPKMERKPKGQTFPQTYKTQPAFKLPTMEDLDTMLPSAGDSHEAKIAQELGQFMPFTGEELIPAGRAIASSVKKLAPTAAEMALDLASTYGVDPRMHIIKPKGGNWMPDTPERMTERLKTPHFVNKTPEERLIQHEEALTNPALTQEQKDRIQLFADQTKGQIAVDKWVDQKLNKYIKSEMGTESDPIRLGIERRYEQAKELRAANQKKLDKMADDIDKAQAKGKTTTISERDLAAARQKFAEEEDMAFNGLYHGTAPEGGWANYEAWYEAPVKEKRKRFGMPEEGLGTHPASRHWESTVDDEIGQYSSDGFKAPHMQNSGLIKNNPWLLNLPPDTTLYKLDTIDGNLEFRHMIDELKNSLDPLSNLPKHLKIAPKDLEKMTVDDVSALSGKINAWRNVQKTKTNLEIANNPATHTFKEYPLDESNPKGVSWRQIKKPEGLPEEEAKQAVRDAAKYEGDIMRHCVGGSSHCEPLISGKTELYTLRDAKGEPHVTIEVDAKSAGMQEFKEAGGNYYYARDEALRRMGLDNNSDFRELPLDERNALAAELDKHIHNIYVEKFGEIPKRILEIKGKLNRKPKDEYIPFVQDFIKSGKWSDIADIHHTDLRKAEDVLGQNVVKELRSRGEYVPPVLDFDEAAHFHEMFSPGSLDKYLGGKEEYRKTWNKQDHAQGGAVHMAEGGVINLDDLVVQALSNRAPVNLDDIVNQALTKKFAEGGAAYNTVPDMSDGGQFIQSEAF